MVSQRTTLCVDFKSSAGSVAIDFSGDTRGRIQHLHSRRASERELKQLGFDTLLAAPDFQETLGGRSGIEHGTRLCDWLFGDHDDQAKLFGKLLGGDEAFGSPNVLSAGEDPGEFIYLEIRANTPLLLSQPWHLLSFNGRRLLGERWLIYCAPSGERPRPLDIHLPPTVLLVIPDSDSALASDEHAKAICTRLVNFNSPRRKVVRTCDELRDAAALGWDIVYFYGHGGVDGQQTPHLVFAGETLSVIDLRALLEQMKPSLVYLNACQVAAGGWFGAGNQLSRPGCIVLSHLSSVDARLARDRALRFFERYLGGKEPSPVACFLPRAEDLARARAEWFCGAVHAGAREFRMRGQAAMATRDDVWALRLDRWSQRASVITAVNTDMTKSSSSLRAVAFLAAGDEGNCVRDLGRQLLLALRESDSRQLGSRTVALSVRVPVDPTTSKAWDDELRASLSAERGAGLKVALESCLRGRNLSVGDGLLVWLDFDVHPFDNCPFRPLEWAEQCKRWASELDVEGVRLAFMTVLRTGPNGAHLDQFEKFRRDLEGDIELAEKFVTDRFRLEPLGPLEAAQVGHIVRLFAESPDLTLKGEERRRVAEGVLTVCDASASSPRAAQYDRVVAALEAGRKTAWADYLEAEPNQPRADNGLFSRAPR